MQMSGAGETGRRRLWQAIVAGLGLLALLLVGLFVHDRARQAFLDDTLRRGDTTLRLAVSTLQARLDRFERLPRLIAEQQVIRQLAVEPDNPALVPAANAYMERIARTLGASDVYFMDIDGTTRAASNHAKPTSFVGHNFAFRPYFHDALDGGEGRFYALGINSGKRGYYFGAPVRVGGTIRGVLVFKIDLDAIEDAWRGGDDQIVVTDPGGIVFLSSRSDWLFRPMTEPTAADLAETRATRRYADTDLDATPLLRPTGEEGLVDIALGDRRMTMLKRSEPMVAAGWTVSVLLDTAPAERQARTLTLAVVLALGLGALAAAALIQRRARLRERLALQEAAQAELERRVVERTAELAALNRTLEGEVAERIQAEADLRQAQADLVQAAKLAALGQMSAALSHEFNQPLAAARTYAENALTLLDRGRTDEARGNAERILSLIDRMTGLSRHLRTFARKPGQKVGTATLPEIIAAASEIAGPRLRAAEAELSLDIAPDLPAVAAGPLRLEQVLVNVLTNAADAVDGTADRRIHVTASATETGARITVRDHGPGVPASLRDRIFDPFFSTKGVGKGLGLGLSISYNIIRDFGGTLSVADAPGGGAAFHVDLLRAAARNAA